MKTQKDIVYFLGIGGIGMSALARWFHSRGASVYGYDAFATPLTRQLEKEGMHIHYEADVSFIPEKVDRVVFTPAVPQENPEFRYFREKGMKMEKRAEVLGSVSSGLYTLAIAGTHGKTSITAMVAHILREAGVPIVAFIGGIAKNFGTNFVLDANPQCMVVEADEFDHSLLTLHPDVAVVTSEDADHLDVYAGLEELRRTFVKFIRLLPPKGMLVHHVKLKNFEEEQVNRITYGLLEGAELTAENISIEDGRFCFDILYKGNVLTNLKMQVPGEHYVENALAAVGVALQMGIKAPVIKRALDDFQGVVRRFDYRIKTPERIYIDDYAHHPEEIRVTLKAARRLYPEKKMTVVFQPHLYSRTRDFAGDFARVLGQADQLVLLDIYPARERPIPGVTSALIADKVKGTQKQLMSKAELPAFLKQEKPELLLTLGAGDIGLMVKEIEKILLDL